MYILPLDSKQVDTNVVVAVEQTLSQDGNREFSFKECLLRLVLFGENLLIPSPFPTTREDFYLNLKGNRDSTESPPLT
jgi:hypothetical protein